MPASARLPRLVAWAWVGVLVVCLGVAFANHGWPFVDTLKVLYTAKVLNIKGAIIDAFRREVEYRPIFTISTKLIYDVAGLRVWVYKAITLAQFAAILGCYLALFRVATKRDALAACLAIGCFVGLHSTRVLFTFYPISLHSLALLLILVTAVLAVNADRPRRWFWYFALSLIAPMVLELGILAPMLVVVLALAGAPGVDRRGAIGSVAGFLIYAVVRVSLSPIGGQVPWFLHESGLGFSMVEDHRLRELFGHAPYLFWIYNVVATLMTVLFSEPRGGQFNFLAGLIVGATPAWQWAHLVSSILTTLIVAWAIVGRRLEGRERHLAGLGATLLFAGSLFGFLYTRDRIALAAGAGYAVLVFVAFSRLTAPAGWRRPLAVSLASLVFALWTVRDIEAVLHVRDRAYENYLDWVSRYDATGALLVPDAEFREQMHAAVMASPPPDPGCDPAWTKRIFERIFPGPGQNCGG